MLSKIFGRKSAKEGASEAFEELQERISKMNLTDLSLYVKGRLDGVELNEEGLIMVLERLLSKVDGKRYFLDESDDDSKLKKGFDLVLLCAKNRAVTLKAMELIAQFANHYHHLIHEYDKRHKDIYEDRLKKALDQSSEIIEAKVALQNKMNILD